MILRYEIIDKIYNHIDNNYVYPSVAECMHRWLDVCEVKNLIINKSKN